MPRRPLPNIASSPCASCKFLIECREQVLTGEAAFCEVDSPRHAEYAAAYKRGFPPASYWDMDYWLIQNRVLAEGARPLTVLRQENIGGEYVSA